MKAQIEIKSALLGLVLGAGIMFTIGAGTAQNETGRYQISAGTGIAVLVDTRTGQSWGYMPNTSAENKNDGAVFWDAK